MQTKGKISGIGNKKVKIMKVAPIKNNMNFRAGLTPEILAMEQKINPKKTEALFRYTKFNDWRDFQCLDLKGNKAYALACKLCYDLFKEFKKNWNYVKGVSMQKHVLPHDIYVFNNEDLTETAKEKEDFFFVNWDYLHDFDKNTVSFEPGTIFLSNKYPDLKSIDKQMDINKKNHYTSTNHFLHWFVHEWLHAIQQKIVHNLTSDLGQGGYNCTTDKYQAAKLTKEERNVVFDVLGIYAAKELNRGEYPEVFAEGWAKCILEAIDKDCVHFKKSPLDILKKQPKEFQDLLWKVSDVDICWSELSAKYKFMNE